MIDININDILNYLDEGKTRKEIAEIYDMPMSQLTLLFKDARLKGKRTKPQSKYRLVGEIVEGTDVPVANPSGASVIPDEVANPQWDNG